MSDYGLDGWVMCFLGAFVLLSPILAFAALLLVMGGT